MGIAERDYMRDRPRGPRNTFNVSGGSGGWTQKKIALVFISVAAMLYWSFKYVIDSKGVPFPQTGEVIWFVPPPDGTGAPLTISAPAKGANQHVVRLEDWGSSRLVAIIPVRAGETAKVSVPLGRYQLTLASGTYWKGPEKMFGITGERQKAVAPMHFYRVNNTTTGHTIDLTKRLDGNLETRPAIFE